MRLGLSDASYPRAFLPLLAFPPQRRDVVGRLSRLTPLRPGLHQRPALLQSIGPPISLLGLIPDDMRKGSFGELAREVCLVARPIAEARSEPMNRSVGNSKARQNLCHCDV